MTFVGLGTAVNVIAVVIGSLVGLAVGGRLGERTSGTVTDVLGLATIVMGAMGVRPLLQPTLGDAVGDLAFIVVLLALLFGTLIGSAPRLEDRINDLGEWTRSRVGGGGRFVDGIVTATLLFCVGPMAILGSLQDGLGQGATQLVTKAILDGFASIAFASAFGIGVMFAAIPLALYQGSLTALGWALGSVMPADEVAALSVAGGLILMGLGVRLLNLKPVRVADMLPALVLAPVFLEIAKVFL